MPVLQLPSNFYRFCTDFAYISVVKCKHHKFAYCLYHQLICGCSFDNLEVLYRFTIKEMVEWERRITHEIDKESKQAEDSSNENSLIGKGKKRTAPEK